MDSGCAGLNFKIMGLFSEKIKRAQHQKHIQSQTERVFSALITLFILWMNDLEANDQAATPELIDTKITELDTEWQKYCEDNKQFLTKDAYKILRQELHDIMEETKKRIEDQVGPEGTPEISKN